MKTHFLAPFAYLPLAFNTNSMKRIEITKMILQPIIENSILHGIRYKKDKGYIKIKIFHIHDILSFHVIDNGIGMEKNKINELYQQLNEENSMGRGIGITNVNQRLLLNYGESYGIHIRSKKGLGTSVTFKIPYQPDM